MTISPAQFIQILRHIRLYLFNKLGVIAIRQRDGFIAVSGRADMGVTKNLPQRASCGHPPPVPSLLQVRNPDGAEAVDSLCEVSLYVLLLYTIL